MNARKATFKPMTGGRAITDWLRSFGGISSATQYVSGVVENLALTNQLPFNSRTDEKGCAERPWCSLNPIISCVAVKEVRSVMLRAMSDGNKQLGRICTESYYSSLNNSRA